MGLAHSPKIVTDGLVFAIDTGNDKSYKGPVMSNITNQITQIGTGTANGYSFTASTESVFIPTVGTMTAQVNSGFNNYPAVSTGCCPALFAYGTFNVSPSTLYTYGILYKTTSGYSNPNFMYRYEYNSGGTYLTEQGVHSTTNRIHLGDGWYWAWGTFTTQATASYIITYSFYYNYGTVTDKMYVAKIMIAQGDYTKLNPKYWPNFNTSRANTATVLNLVNTNVVTANGLTYANTGYPTIAGTNNFISIPNSADLRPSLQLSIEFVVKGTPPAGWTPLIGYGNGDYANGNYLVWIETGGALNSLCRINNSGNVTEYRQYSGANVSNTAYQHMIFTMTVGSAIRSYRNGVNTNTPTSLPAGGNFHYNATTSPYQIGGLGSAWFNADVPILRFYNRALSDTEVLQNFNALRGRFGI